MTREIMMGVMGTPIIVTEWRALDSTSRLHDGYWDVARTIIRLERSFGWVGA